jgi:transposase
MPKTYKISKEQALEIRAKMKEVTNVNAYKRLQAVALRGEGKKNDEIAEITKYNSDYAGQLCKIYHKEGIDGLLKDGRKGGNNRNMREEEEKAFLGQFEEAAGKGEIITIGEIAAAYDEEVGKEHESKSTVYALLHRHKWREIVPRPKHPESASKRRD